MPVFIGFLVGFVGVVCLGGGIALGLGLYGYLARYFQRSADEAWQRAYEKAYADYMKQLEDRRRKKENWEDGPQPKNAEEDMQTFEESVQNIYPGDKEIQQKAIEAKKARDLGGR